MDDLDFLEKSIIHAIFTASVFKFQEIKEVYLEVKSFDKTIEVLKYSLPLIDEGNFTILSLETMPYMRNISDVMNKGPWIFGFVNGEQIWLYNYGEPLCYGRTAARAKYIEILCTNHFDKNKILFAKPFKQ